MNQNNLLSFESENLVVDYISFNLKGLIEYDHIMKIASYLFHSFGFNSFLTYYDQTQGWKDIPLFSQSTNFHEVRFHECKYNRKIQSYWVGTQIHFSGENGTHFYNQVKKPQFDWGIFNGLDVTLSRIDVCYFRETKLTDSNELVNNFMEKCCKKVQSIDKRRVAKYALEKNGWILKIGARKSPKHYRVYENMQGLRFELEIKKGLVKLFQELLMDNRFQALENDLSKLFYSQSFDSLIFNSCYTDWLIHWYRTRSNKKDLNRFITSYFKIKNKFSLEDNKKLIFDFFRILSFIRNKEYIHQTFKIDDDPQTFHVVKFHLVDFLRFINLNEKNHRHRRNTVEIFKSFEYIHAFQLQTFRTILNDCLSMGGDDIEFTSVVMIPFFKIKKENNQWNVVLLVAKQFYEYNFPFQFKDYFLNWNTVHEFEVKAQILQLLSQPTQEKKMDIERFFASFDELSNSKKTEIKQLFIEGILAEVEMHSLELKFKIIQKNDSIKILKQLRPINFTKSRYIYFYERINYRSFLKNF